MVLTKITITTKSRNEQNNINTKQNKDKKSLVLLRSEMKRLVHFLRRRFNGDLKTTN